MQRMLTVILAFLGMVGALAIDTYLPSMPAIGREFNVGPVAVQQTLSIFLFAFAFMMLFYGTLSDSFGRRPVIMVALVVYTLASVGAALAPSFGWLLVCRALQGLSAGSGSVIGAAIVQDRFSGPQAQKMMSHIMMVFGLAPAIAPVLGGWLHVHFGWRSTFWFLAGFGALMVLLAWRALPESLPKEKRHAFHPGAIAANYLMVLRNPRFLLLSLAVGMAFGGLSLYIGSAANFVMEILHLPETAFGWMFIPLIGGMVLGSAWGGKAAARIAPKRMKWIGFAVMALGAGMGVVYNLLFVAQVPWAVLPLAVFTFGLAAAMPPIQLSAFALFPDNRGLTSSMLSFIQMLSFAIVSGVVAPLLFDSALNLSLGMMGGLVLSFICWRLSGLERFAAKEFVAA
ncbi:Bcr/CflA family drug resistance efflux transporter [Massilia eurypsychrophila]|jgi:DHA1 family bicyclomycin/chloramphenicol resistance-like MFS transporter|uniref:Bcr/CflA family efflux transporter n=1 Tax=Massilia eurypsychrophila TaxID=1485217 RepID=A0A2G8TIM2_9BURK|nr:multidrug effflux MFS transporter [Massilia eurypsychrophila]PIL45895.1 Bcr/CflA family drug resistance efflux transporter [Massilia eurypsychrophila]